MHLLQNECPHFIIKGAWEAVSNIILHISHFIKSSIIDLSIILKVLKENPVVSVLLFVLMWVFSWCSFILYFFDYFLEILFFIIIINLIIN